MPLPQLNPQSSVAPERDPSTNPRHKPMTLSLFPSTGCQPSQLPGTHPALPSPMGLEIPEDQPMAKVLRTQTCQGRALGVQPEAGIASSQQGPLERTKAFLGPFIRLFCKYVLSTPSAPGPWRDPGGSQSSHSSGGHFEAAIAHSMVSARGCRSTEMAGRGLWTWADCLSS